MKNGNGFIKDYDDYYEDLLFEGEYKNGEKNGKGRIKEYESGELIFEGEYLNGERNGKGKEFNFFGKLVFEGEYLKGKKWNGKGFDKNNHHENYYIHPFSFSFCHLDIFLQI